MRTHARTRAHAHTHHIYINTHKFWDIVLKYNKKENLNLRHSSGAWRDSGEDHVCVCLHVIISCHQLDNQLTPRRRNLLEIMVVTQLVNRFPSFYGILRYVTMQEHEAVLSQLNLV